MNCVLRSFFRKYLHETIDWQFHFPAYRQCAKGYLLIGRAGAMPIDNTPDPVNRGHDLPPKTHLRSISISDLSNILSKSAKFLHVKSYSSLHSQPFHTQFGKISFFLIQPSSHIQGSSSKIKDQASKNVQILPSLFKFLVFALNTLDS